MASILLANTNTKGSGLTKGTSADSGNIVTVGKSGAPKRRLTYGGQAQATQPIQCDRTAGVVGNAIGPKSPSATPIATITNIAVATTNGVSTATVTAVNSFAAGMTVKFDGLTLATALNGFCGVVTSTGLSGSGFQATLVGFTAGTVGSGAETGNATVHYQARTALLSISSDSQ